MHKPTTVRVMQSLSRLTNNRRRNGKGQGTIAAHELSQIRSGHVFSNKEISVAFEISVRHTHQIRVIKLSLRPDLALKRRHRLRRALALGQHLDRFDTTQQLVLGLE